jgi:hypothetical protein
MIFNNKTVVGLFDNDKDMETALDQLQKLGFGPEDEASLEIIDQYRLAQETPIDALGGEIPAQPKRGLVVDGAAVGYNPITDAGLEIGNIEQRTHEVLTDRGLGDEEAWFYARQVARGNSLIIIETDQEQTVEAADLLKQAGARTLET